MSNEDIAAEQTYISMLYGRLDELRERASRRLAGVLRQQGGTHQARTEREVFSLQYSQQIAQLDAAENRLCFGRLDFTDGERRYIGRIGIHADSDDYQQLLMDWRADAARPFYLATAMSPENVRRRRHIETRDRVVTSLDDEILDLASADPDRRDGLTGEAALLAAMTASRTGRMSDIVETIQAEQDRIIRSPLPGVLVVQGGPGTGKTAVALHRAAYLLYTHRRQLLRRGVLVVGPNATFLRYIGQVLPSLGETSVLLSTMDGLYPGITPTAAESAETALVKGRAVMARVIASAVRDRQLVPDAGLEVIFDRDTFVLRKKSIAQAREKARRSRRPHNQARKVFAREMFTAIAEQAAARLGANVLGGPNLLSEGDLEELRDEVRADPAVRAAVSGLWPLLTPQQLLEDLLTDEDRLASAASGLSAADRDLLLRKPGGGWTPADIPLLDEAAELLGEDDSATPGRGRARPPGAGELRPGRAGHHVPYRRGRPGDPDGRGPGRRDPAGGQGRGGAVPDRRGARRGRQDLGVRARDRGRGAGAVGDGLADADAPLPGQVDDDRRRRGADRRPGRGRVLGPGPRPVPAGPLAAGRADHQLPDPGRDHGRRRGPADRDRPRPRAAALGARVRPAAVAAGRGPNGQPVMTSPVLASRATGSPATLAAAAAKLAGLTGDGRLGVIVPASRLAELTEAVTAALPAVASGDEVDLESPVVVLSTRQAKGLEFDSVLIADPGLILAESPRGRSDLYVAMTRSTQRLGVVHPGEPPSLLRGLAELTSAAEIS